MSPPEAPHEPSPGRPTADRGERRASQRIAIGTLARSSGEVVGKLASLVFFVVVARELGESDFGDLMFGISLSTVLLLGAGLGMQELVAREVAKDPRRVDELLWNVVVLKGLMMLALLVVIAVVVTIQDHSPESRLAILIVSGGIGLEYQANSIYAVLVGNERQHHVATAIIVNRISTAVLGIGVLLAGGDLVAVAIVFTVGSALGLGTAYWLMRRYVARPSRQVDPSAWRGLVQTSLPLGVISVLGTVSFRTSIVWLGLISASSAEVGEYSAAFRLIEATLFISDSFGYSVLPWFSRHPGHGDVSLARGFSMSLKAVVAMMLPLALGLILFAEPLIETLYGAQYDGAVTPLRLLGAMTVLWGINAMIVTVLIARDRPDAYTRPAALALVPNLALAFVLIPLYGADGAALAAVISAAVLVTMTMPATVRLIGALPVMPIIVAPLAAGASMALVAIVLSGAPWVLALLPSVAAYGVAFLVIERVLFPGDFAYYTGALRLLRRPEPV
jgi:O-antigen/teichoic acid export membrane protein